MFTFLDAASADAVGGPSLFGIPVAFLLFAATLIGISIFRRHTFEIALAGLAAIALWLLRFDGFSEGVGWPGLTNHLAKEWVALANLAGLLLGFAVLERHFEKSYLAAAVARYVPRGAPGPFALLTVIFVLSAFLDNIAAALIGGAMAQSLFRRRVHIGYLVAIVGAYGSDPSVLMVPRDSRTAERLGERFINFEGSRTVSPAVYRDLVSTCARASADPRENRVEMIQFARRQRGFLEECCEEL